jgi:hypothetical protein
MEKVQNEEISNNVIATNVQRITRVSCENSFERLHL